ncbi:MAG: acyltransferase family protein [Paludibacter sp.]|nr:acyltransferase family protein [Paludibacter sp.]
MGNKVIYFDNLRVIATIGVIFVHVDINTLNEYNKIPEVSWWIANFFQSLFCFCIPIFVMITGALLLPKDIELKCFLKNRFFRLIIPFLFWSFIYILFNFKFLPQRNEMSIVEIMKWFFLQINGLSSVHFWYIYMIIGVYLTIPIIGGWIRNSGKNEINYFLILWLISIIINQPVFSNFKPNIDLTYFSGFMGYLILGYYLSIKKIESSKVSIILILTGFILTTLGTYFYSRNHGSFDSHLYQSFSPNVIILSTGVFLFLKNRNSHFESVNSCSKQADVNLKLSILARNFICKYSYGIYLIHVLILILLDKVGISSDLINPILGIPVTVVMCLLISGTIIYTINKIPFGEYISG